MNDIPYGYDVPGGHRGRLPDGTWMLFPTEKEYTECFSEAFLEINRKADFQNSCILTPSQQPILSVI